MTYVKKILRLMIKRGKKTIAFNNVNASIVHLRKKLSLARLDRSLDLLMPSVKIYKKKVAGKVYQIPSIISRQRSLFQTAKWITTAVAAEKKGKKLSKRLSKVILETVRHKGMSWKLRDQYLAVIKENRSYMRFIRKKRKKKKKWVFKQRFTNKIIRKDHRELNKKLKSQQLNKFINYNEKRKKVSTKNKKPRRKK